MSNPGFRPAKAALLVSVLLLAGCGGTPSPAGPSNGPPGSGGSSTPAAIQHVVIVLEENHGYSSVIGNGEMPYLNGLAAKYAVATNYYANTHPSIGNYFMLTTGELVTNDDAYTGVVSADNLARLLRAGGKSWKVYAESLPAAGYLGGDQYPYVKHHNPFAYFSDVVNDAAQAQNIVPFPQFGRDQAAGAMPTFAFVVPNELNNGHDGTLAQSDAWLRSNMDPLVNSASFGQTLLIVVYDESDSSDAAHGGGHVAAVLAGGRVKLGLKSTTLYQHQSLLRLMVESLGLSGAPAAAGSAPAMSEFLQ